MQFFERHADERTVAASQELLRRPVGKSTAELAPVVTGIPGKAQDAVGRMLDQRPDQMLRVRQRRQRLLALGDVAAHDDRALALARRSDQRRTVQLVVAIRMHANRLRQVAVLGMIQDCLCFGQVLPQGLADQLVFRRIQEQLCRLVRADDLLRLVQNDNRIAHMIEHRLVCQRTEVVDTQCERCIPVKRQHQG